MCILILFLFDYWNSMYIFPSRSCKSNTMTITGYLWTKLNVPSALVVISSLEVKSVVCTCYHILITYLSRPLSMITFLNGTCDRLT